MEPIKNRYEFVMLFDVENGNPNGDPDAGNMPRVDPETQFGLVTDVCLKRKIRNYVDAVMENEPGYAIFINPGKVLNDKLKEALDSTGKDIKAANKYMCDNYYDVRTFGAVMSTGNKGEYSCGTVRGPVQITFAKSIDTISPMELTITRQAVTKKEDSDKNNTMGKKNIVPYAMYRAEGYVSALLAQKTGFSEKDLGILFESILNMFEIDHSAARGKMCMRKLVAFKHDSLLGQCPSDELFQKVHVERLNNVPRAYSDYKITVDKNVHNGVTVFEGENLVSLTEDLKK